MPTDNAIAKDHIHLQYDFLLILLILKTITQYKKIISLSQIMCIKLLKMYILPFFNDFFYDFLLKKYICAIWNPIKSIFRRSLTA